MLILARLKGAASTKRNISANHYGTLALLTPVRVAFAFHFQPFESRYSHGFNLTISTYLFNLFRIQNPNSLVWFAENLRLCSLRLHAYLLP